jgi:hypothetical protein
MANYNVPWNKGLIGIAVGDKNPMYGRHHSEETKNKISLANSGKGHPHTPESKLKISIAHRGSKSHLWKGGITPKVDRDRNGLEYREWRNFVFIRDNYTCQECGQRGGKLNVHHKEEVSCFPEKMYDKENGITLCVKCHKTTDTYGWNNLWRSRERN